MKISFIVPGNPQGKARPRVCRINGKSITYTPKKTVEYEKLIRTSAVAEIKNFEQRREPCYDAIRASYNAVSGVKFEKNVPLEMNILALFSLPKTASKKFVNAALNNEVYPAKKPDCDNIIKVICDALNGLAYHDDSQVCRVYFEKTYAPIPCVKVEIKAIKEV